MRAPAFTRGMLATAGEAMDGDEHPGLKRPSGHVGFLGQGSRLEIRNSLGTVG